jgi:hypothetical protein
LIGNVLIVNSPQIIFSSIYFSFNGLLTSMTLAAEWSSYVNERKGHRVSNNLKGFQRSNYFLSVPYRYGIPLIILSVLLHWLISQSLFMVGIEAWDSDGKRHKTNDFKTCCWSNVGILSTTIVGIVFLAGIIGLSFRRSKSGMPVVASCSLAIAAACHPHFDPNIQHGHGDEDADMEMEDRGLEMALLPVRWGAVPVDGPSGHCSFTSDTVREPETGRVSYQ